MNTEQERAEFEAWLKERGVWPALTYEEAFVAGYQTGRAAGIRDGRAVLQSQDREDAERYRYLISKLQQVYDGDYFETDLMSLYCHMPSQYKGERTVRAEITWRDKTDEPIGLSEAIDHARRAEGDGE